MANLLFFSVLLSVSTLWADNRTCTRQIVAYDNIQVGRDYWTGSQTCFLSVHPRNGYTNLLYRDYLMTNHGLFMVFNSYGPGETSKTTGAREFYFFPRQEEKTLEAIYDEGRQEVTVKVTDDLFFVFDSKTAQIKGLSKGSVSVDPDVNKNNAGGVEIKSFDGLWLDVGFSMGHSPSERAKFKSTFTDNFGRTCGVVNKNIFDYADDDVRFKWNDQDLKKYLAGVCSNLNVGF